MRDALFGLVMLALGCGAEPSRGGAAASPSEPRSGVDEPRSDVEGTMPAQDEPSEPEEPAQTTPPGAPLDDAGLVAAVRARWATLRDGAQAQHPMRARVDALVQSSASVRASACVDARRSMEARGARAEDFLEGGMDRLDAGDCRVVFFDGRLGPSLEAVLRPDGQVLTLRIVAEG